MESITNTQNLNQLSKIVVCSYEQLILPRNVEKVVLPENIAESAGFNQVLKSHKDCIFCFLSRYDTVYDNKIFEKVTQVFNEKPYINFIYTDTIIHKNNRNFKHFNLSADINNIIYSKLNTPIFVKSNHILFDETLKELYFHKILLMLSQVSVGMHIPMFAFKSIHHETPILDQEYKLIHNEQSH